jgi:hypothetical protein
MTGQAERSKGLELQEIVERIAKGIQDIDYLDHESRFNQRTGVAYDPGVKSLTETLLVKALDDWWGDRHSEDFVDSSHSIGVKYPNIPRAKCDFVFTTSGSIKPPEWAVEVKKIELIGDNGKGNDYPVEKMLSPFLKDRSLLHDVRRLRGDPIARRQAVIGYSFSYDHESCEEALRKHPDHHAKIHEIRMVCRKNGGRLSVDPLIEFADAVLRVRNEVEGQLVKVPFEAWRHPCGGNGVVFGWEVKLIQGENFDPRHPW